MDMDAIKQMGLDGSGGKVRLFQEFNTRSTQQPSQFNISSDES